VRRNAIVILLLLPVALVAAILLLWPKLKATFNAQAPTPVYLVAIDTLRTDALSVYGGKRPTPFFEEFAKQAIVFDNCIAPASWTVPSMASLFTGLYPFHHGSVMALQQRGQVKMQEKLSSGYLTIPEVFKERAPQGVQYHTYGVSGNGHLTEEYGFAQGFDEYVAHRFDNKNAVQSSWQGMLPRVAAQYRFGEGIFAFLFYFDPHHPYAPQEPWIKEYYPEYLQPSSQILSHDMLDLWEQGFFTENPEMVKVARAMYDSEVAALDDHLRGVFAELPGYDEAIIVIVSDHGEEFLEHGNMIHGNNLHQTQVNVPLMIKLPHNEHAGLRIKEKVMPIDVLPTLAELIDAGDVGQVDGRSLAPLWRAEKWENRDLFLHLSVPWARHRALIRDRYKVIGTAAHEPLVFDLEADPDEKHDLYAERRGEFQPWLLELKKATEMKVRYTPEIVEENMTDEERDHLRNLGYLN